jgi:hypothetical protein
MSLPRQPGNLRASLPMSNTLSIGLGKGASMRYKSNTRSIERLFGISRRSLTMNASTLEAPAASARTALRPSARVSTPTRTRRRPGVGRGTGPQARPPRPLGLATPGRPLTSRSQSCAVDAPPVVEPARAARWRLTERGIALVLVAGLLIVTASLTVVGLTALRVTSDSYQAAGQSVLAQP